MANGPASRPSTDGLISADGRVSRAIRWMATSWVLWTVVVLLDVAPALVRGSSPGEFIDPNDARRFIIVRVAGWYGWWLLTPFIFYLARRFGFAPGVRRRSFAVHAVAALAAIEIDNAIVIASWR